MDLLSYILPYPYEAYTEINRLLSNGFDDCQVFLKELANESFNEGAKHMGWIE